MLKIIYKGFRISMIDRQTWRVVTADGREYGRYRTPAIAQKVIDNTPPA